MFPKHYKIGFFEDFEKFILGFLGQNCRVNNLATSRSITWSHFSRIFGGKGGQVVDFEVSLFFEDLFFFFKKSHFPCRKKIILEKQWNKGGQVIDLWWPNYWPYSIYIYIYIYISYIYIHTYTRTLFAMVMIWVTRGPTINHPASRPSKFAELCTLSSRSRKCEAFILAAWLSSICGLHHDNVTNFFWRPCDFSVSLLRSGPYLVSLIHCVFHRTNPTVNRIRVYHIWIDFEVPRGEFLRVSWRLLCGLQGLRDTFLLMCARLFCTMASRMAKPLELVSKSMSLKFLCFLGGSSCLLLATTRVSMNTQYALEKATALRRCTVRWGHKQMEQVVTPCFTG